MDEKKLRVALIKFNSGRTIAAVDKLFAGLRGILSDQTLLEKPFGPFTGDHRARLRQIAETTGNPDFFIAYVRVRYELNERCQKLFSEDDTVARFLGHLETSLAKRATVKDAKGNVVQLPLSEISIVQQIDDAVAALLEKDTRRLVEGRTRALRELDPFEMGDGVFGSDRILRKL
ncbi:MAG: hypothetical protein V1861_03060 [Candidatus Micrarchaeota archaeon]